MGTFSWKVKMIRQTSLIFLFCFCLLGPTLPGIVFPISLDVNEDTIDEDANGIEVDLLGGFGYSNSMWDIRYPVAGIKNINRQNKNVKKGGIDEEEISNDENHIEFISSHVDVDESAERRDESALNEAEISMMESNRENGELNSEESLEIESHVAIGEAVTLDIKDDSEKSTFELEDNSDDLPMIAIDEVVDTDESESEPSIDADEVQYDLNPLKHQSEENEIEIESISNEYAEGDFELMGSNEQFESQEEERTNSLELVADDDDNQVSKKIQEIEDQDQRNDKGYIDAEVETAEGNMQVNDIVLKANSYEDAKSTEEMANFGDVENMELGTEINEQWPTPKVFNNMAQAVNTEGTESSKEMADSDGYVETMEQGSNIVDQSNKSTSNVRKLSVELPLVIFMLGIFFV